MQGVNCTPATYKTAGFIGFYVASVYNSSFKWTTVGSKWCIFSGSVCQRMEMSLLFYDYCHWAFTEKWAYILRKELFVLFSFSQSPSIKHSPHPAVTHSWWTNLSFTEKQPSQNYANITLNTNLSIFDLAFKNFTEIHRFCHFIFITWS